MGRPAQHYHQDGKFGGEPKTCDEEPPPSRCHIDYETVLDWRQRGFNIADIAGFTNSTQAAVFERLVEMGLWPRVPKRRANAKNAEDILALSRQENTPCA